MPIAAALTLLLSTSLAQASVTDVPLPPPPAPPQATAALPAPPPPPAVEAPPADRLPRFGVAVDAGVPDGVALSAMWRPLPALRVFGGPSWNYLGFGAHAGATWAPLRWAVAPTLTGEVGRYFSADLSWLAQNSGGVPRGVEPLLRDVSYDFASVLVGLEIGSHRGFAFTARAGLSYLWLVARGTATTSTSGGTPGPNDTRVELKDPHIKATIPSVQLGMQYWF